MTRLAALVLGLVWVVVGIVLLLGAVVMASLFVFPCAVSGQACGSAFSHAVLFDTLPEADLLRALQLLTLTLGLLSLCAVIASASILNFALFRGQQSAAALGAGFSILIAVVLLLTLDGVGRAQAWDKQVSGGCQTPVQTDNGLVLLYGCSTYTQDCDPDHLGILAALTPGSPPDAGLSPYTPMEFCTAVTQLSCRLPDDVAANLVATGQASQQCTQEGTVKLADVMGQNRFPYAYAAGEYDKALNLVGWGSLGLLVVTILFTPWLLTASAHPPPHLKRQFRSRRAVCQECGRLGQAGGMPVCPLCQPPFVLSVESDQVVYKYAETKTLLLRIRLKPRDPANAYIPLSRMQIDVHLPAGLDYDHDQRETGWALDPHRGGRHLRFNSPSVFLTTTESGASTPEAELQISLYLLGSIRRQFRREQAYPVEITATPLDGLTRKLETQRENIRIRRSAWLSRGGA